MATWLGWYVSRNRQPLVGARSPRPAVFYSVFAAKAAGLLHLQDSFGNKVPYKDGLWWQNSRPEGEHFAVETSGDFPVDPSISYDHEWGRERLDQLLKASVATARTADAIDENLVLDLEGVARSWQLPPPLWTRRANGQSSATCPLCTVSHSEPAVSQTHASLANHSCMRRHSGQ